MSSLSLCDLPTHQVDVRQVAAERVRTSSRAISAPSRLEVSARFCSIEASTHFCGSAGSGTASGMVARGVASTCVLHVGDLAQQFLRGGELALRGDQVRGGGVARGARFLHVGDGDEADFEALVGLLELARNRVERRLLRLHVVQRGEHVEVARGHTQREVLLSHAVVRIRLRGNSSTIA